MLLFWNLQKITIFFRNAKPTFTGSLNIPYSWSLSISYPYSTGWKKRRQVKREVFCHSELPFARKLEAIVLKNTLNEWYVGHLLPWSDLERCMYGKLFFLFMIKFYRYYLIYKCNFTRSLFSTTWRSIKDKKHLNFKGNFYF